MITEEIRQKIKRIKIQTGRVMHTSLSGDYAAAFKGSGLEFDQLREYQIGDDVRNLDWNSSAKMDKLMIKQFIEERDRTVILCIDISASSQFGSGSLLRNELIAQVGAALTFITQHHKDKVGALFFSDIIEEWIPPKRSSLHVGTIIEKIFSLQAKNKRTNPDVALRFLIDLKKKNSILFFLSDWIFDSPAYEKLLRIAAIEYDMVALRFIDDRERSFVDVGLIEIEDSETGACFTIDTSAKNQQQQTIQNALDNRLIQQKRLFDKYKIDYVDIPLHENFFSHLAAYFHARTKRQI
jgi:uncharacterized protein (DUF58 family)